MDKVLKKFLADDDLRGLNKTLYYRGHLMGVMVFGQDSIKIKYPTL